MQNGKFERNPTPKGAFQNGSKLQNATAHKTMKSFTSNVNGGAAIQLEKPIDVSNGTVDLNKINGESTVECT
jgi:hypothetical protein